MSVERLHTWHILTFINSGFKKTELYDRGHVIAIKYVTISLHVKTRVCCLTQRADQEPVRQLQLLNYFFSGLIAVCSGLNLLRQCNERELILP
jgi:hypothetical protein